MMWAKIVSDVRRGKRYQWSEMETIVIDLEALREIKLDNLGI